MLPSLLRRSALAAGLAAATLATSTVASAQNGFWAQVQVGSPLAGYSGTGNNLLNGGGYVAKGSITVRAGTLQQGAGMPTGQLITIDQFFCTDQQNLISLPISYTAWISFLSPSANMSQTRIGSRNPASPVTANTLYTMNASLANSMAIGTGTNAQMSAQYAANNMLQSQIWDNSMNPGTPNFGSATYNTNGWFVVTAPPGSGQFGGTQELIAYSSAIQTISSVVPEPGTYALLVPALFAVGVLARRRRTSTLAS